MRYQIEITELTDVQWVAAQRVLRTSYEFPEGANRVCLVIVHGDEERHAEMPMGSFITIAMTLGLAPSVHAMNAALAAHRAEKPGEKP